MLIHLSIKNFAIIEELETEFHNGFTAITGETGAGKSILLGALGLVLGDRADSSSLMNPEKKLVVEATFDIRNHPGVKQWLKEQQEEETEQLILRREIHTTGKSRAFINDSPVTVAQLKTLTAQLVDLHQQFDTLELGEESFQREVLDALCKQTAQTAIYHQQYLHYAKLQKELFALKESQEQASKERDYHQFLADELEQAHFQPGELEQLEQELKMLNSAETIAQVLSESVRLLQDSETPLLQQLKQVLNRIQHYTDVLPSLQPLAERLQSAQIELADITDELDNLQQQTAFDEERMRLIEDRLELGYKLLKKHHLRTTEELLHLQKELNQKLEQQFNQQELILQKEKELDQLLHELKQQAEQIHKNRIAQQHPLEEKVNALLIKVGMPNARLKIEVRKTELNAYGNDEIDFLFDANKSNRFESIHKVASGGELSRLMLCIKSLVASVIELPTMVFDEIDTGISGEAAKQVGLLLKDLSQHHQVITITHLPQIAAKATHHFYVYKEEVKERIQTKIRLLNHDEQVEAIAKMLSGETITQSSLVTAREMVKG